MTGIYGKPKGRAGNAKEAIGLPLENRLKEYRARQGLNQGQMGQLVGVSRQTISLIERGDYNPSVTLALRIAAVFRVQVEDIFSLTGEEEE
jgi:putative transcriptional regulator